MVEGRSFENSRTERFRGFESLTLLHYKRIKMFFKNYFKLIKRAHKEEDLLKIFQAILLGWFVCLFFTDKELN